MCDARPQQDTIAPESTSEERVEEHKEFDFSSVYSENLPNILYGLKVSLAVTSYQSQRLFFLRSDGKEINTCFYEFLRPMGIYADQERLTLATATQVHEFKRCEGILANMKAGGLDDISKMTKKVQEKDSELMRRLEEERTKELGLIKMADALFLSRATLTTGMINTHDIAWGKEGLWVVNTTFSCLSTLSPTHSFVARWKPPFISELAPEGRCHLNGMAMKDGKPAYVTSFNRSNSLDSWKEKDCNNGNLMEVESGRVLLDGMIMPHSPRYHRGKLYVCDSGRGTILELDPQSGRVRELIKLQGFPRGMNFLGPLMFVGLSRTRASETKEKLPINEEFDETLSGIWVINLEDASDVAHLRFTGDVGQIYDIAVIPEACWPELLKTDSTLIRHIYDYMEAL